MNTTTCPYCNKTFKTSGIEVHITLKHSYQIWKSQQQARKSK